jgi:hypothetical protein
MIRYPVTDCWRSRWKEKAPDKTLTMIAEGDRR